LTQRTLIRIVTALLFLLSFNHIASAKTLQFSGYTWEVRSGGGNPGPCDWKDTNAWTDENGFLHLRLSKSNGVWHCAEVSMLESLDFGKYQFWVIGQIDTLDPSVVLGLFSYLGPPGSGTNEIDVEIARWGDPTRENLDYNVYPSFADSSCQNNIDDCAHGKEFYFTLNGSYTTHRYIWDSTNVLFKSLHDHVNNNDNLFAKWRFTPANYLKRIPQGPMPIHMNLWLFDQVPPADGQPVEIVIRSFTYTPLSSLTAKDYE
jgi:hypothetical protein